MIRRFVQRRIGIRPSSIFEAEIGTAFGEGETEMNGPFTLAQPITVPDDVPQITLAELLMRGYVLKLNVEAGPYITLLWAEAQRVRTHTVYEQITLPLTDAQIAAVMDKLYQAVRAWEYADSLQEPL